MRTYEVTMMVTRFETVLTQAENVEAAHLEAQAKTTTCEGENAKVWNAKDVTPIPRTVKERINASFKKLRKVGVVARMNYQCCNSCGWAALESDYPKFNDETDTAVFYHRQDAEAFDEYGNLGTYRSYDDKGNYTKEPRSIYLSHHGNAELIVQALRNEGLTIDWNGKQGRKIAVTGVKGGTL